MAALSVTGLEMKVGRFQLGPLNLDVADGQTLVLLGPSGSGKTLLLETLAGFHRPKLGTIQLKGQDVTRLPPERRRLALVVQDYALFPHLNVRQNVAFGLRYQHRPAGSVDRALVALGIADLAQRRTPRLSGGERQRVALARALVTEPAAFLLDEPFAALDAATRREVRDELARLLVRLRTTCVLVTHDQADAFALGHRIAVLAGGRVQQVGKPEWVYRRPVNAWVAAFLGMEALRVERVEGDSAQPVYLVAGVRLHVAPDALSPGTQLVYRPEDVTLSPDAGKGGRTLQGKIETLQPEGALTRLGIGLVDGQRLAALLSRRELQRLGAERGQCVGCVIEADDLWPVTGDAPVEPDRA